MTLPARTSRIRMSPASPSRKSERLNVRVTKQERELLTEASRATQRTVSQFVLDVATEAAERVLADRTRFELPADSWDRFVRALDAPVAPLPRLRRLLETPTVLDEA